MNGAWHGDIHYLCYNNEIKYLFVIIDDRSRYIVGYDISDNKDMQLVNSVLTKSIQNYGAPFIFWTDNGKENVNNLIKGLLDRYTITHIKTMPHTPRQNGKIERWWIELEKRLCPSDSWEIIYEKINDYIYKYNNIIPHHGLEMIGNFHPTPSEIFFSPHLQKTSKENCKIKIDGKPVGIVEFAKLDIEKEKNEIMKKIDITDPFSLLSRPVSF